MVDDAHKEEDIKAVRKEGEMLDAEQVDMERLLPGHAVQGLETVVVLHGRFQTEHQFWSVGGHAEHVVAVVAADIGDDLALEVGQHGQQPLPFAFAPPLGVDVDTKDGKGAFAPGHEGAHGRFDLRLIAATQFIGAADDDGVAGAVHGSGRKMGQRFIGVAVAEKAFLGLVDPLLPLLMDGRDLLAAGGGRELGEVLQG